MKIGFFDRGARTVAAFGLLLPWLTVSCSGQKVASANAFDLATGKLSFHNPMTNAVQNQSVDPIWWIGFAILAIFVGLFKAYRSDPEPDEKSAVDLGVASGLGIFLCAAGMISVFTSRDSQLAKAAASGNGIDFAMAQQIRYDTDIGFWITFLALLAAAISNIMMYKGHKEILGETTKEVKAIFDQNIKTDDEKFWDSLVSKSDRDSLEEYIHRFPQGKFFELAKTRLDRLNN